MDGVDGHLPLPASPTGPATMPGQADQDSGEGQISAESVLPESAALSPKGNECEVEHITGTQDETESNTVLAEAGQSMNNNANPSPDNSPSNSDTVANLESRPDSNCGQDNLNDLREMGHGMNIETESTEDISIHGSTVDNTSQPSDLSMRDQCRSSPEDCEMPGREVGMSCPNEAQQMSEHNFDDNREMDLSHSSQHISEVSPENMHHRSMLEESAMKHMDEMQSQSSNHLHGHFPPPCHLEEYQQHINKLTHGHLQDLRDPHRLHEYEEPQYQLFRDHRHMQDGVGDHVHHNSGRPLDGYWNMPLGLISKVKAESKEWYGDNDELLPESLVGPGGLKDDLYSNYRTPPHSNLGHDGMNGPRPPSMPHGGIPFSQTEQQQHYQHYGNHPAMRDMSPMSPGYPSHNRTPMAGSHPHTSQISGSQQFGVQQHSSQHLQQGSQHHLPNQHLQQQYGGQQSYGGQPMGMQSHPGQQVPSPYHQSILGHLAPGMGGHDVREGRERGDPYNFVDEYTGPPSKPIDEVLGQLPKRRGRKPKHIKLMENGGDPLAIAAAQAAHEAKKKKWRQIGPDGKVLPLMSRPRKRIDRFDGISEDELAKKTLPDHLAHNLDIVIISKFPFQIGINPGLFAAYKGHHYAGPGNHFWKCLYLSGLIPEPLSSDDDSQLLEHGIGFTNIVSRTTRGSAELTRKEIKEGGQLLLAKLQRYQPRVAVFNGKGIYEIFSGKKEFTFGRQPEKIEGTHTHVWVMPSSSARCAQLPRALDKVPFYTALRKFRDFLKGTLSELTEEEVTFITKKHIKLEAEKLEGPLLPEMSEAFLDDQLNETCESELDSDEISRSISQSLFNLTGITREQLENMDCATIPIRKKRGRPKKTPEDPNAPSRPKPRPLPTDILLCNGEDPPRKKRGRPKKILEDGTIPVPKRPGRKPKALKEMLAVHSLGPTGEHAHDHMQMSHMNGMMPPSGYNSPSGGPFSPHYGNGSLHSLGGPHSHSGANSSNVPMNSLLGNNRAMSHAGNIGGSSMSVVHSGNSGLQSPMCSTPNNSNGPHTPLNSMPQRVNTPKPYGHSPGYSPGPRSHSQLSQPFSQSAEKSDMPSVDDHDLGLSPPPVSPVMTQPDFEPPTSLPENEGVMASDLSSRTHKEEMSIMERRQHTPSLQNQFSNPSTPVDETTYKNYPYSKACSPYNTNLDPSPSYPQNVAHSPSYPVSVSPTYASNNTQSPCHTIAQSPSYPQNVNNSPSFPPNVSHSPSYPIVSNHSPTYPKATSQSPSYHPTLSQSPSCSSITRSPSYPSSLTHSPSYPPNTTQSPSFRPQLPQSPSFHSNPNHSPALAKPLPIVAHSPHVVKGDVSSKSISGLESLVDQIPSLNESDPSVLQQASSANPCTAASITPGPTNGPFSPPLGASSSYQGFSGGNGGSYPAHYNSPQSSHQYSPHFSSSNTNLSTNFSVSSLANSSITTSLSYSSGYEGESSTTTSSNNIPVTTNSGSNSFSVSSLTGDSPCSTPSMYNNHYSPVPVGPTHNYSELMSSSILPPTPPMGSSFMGSSNVPNNSIHSSMNMSGSQLPYPYPQYGEAGSGYSGHGPSFPYSPTGSGFHLPSRFPYPSPYSGGPYAQGYSQSSVLERIKQTGMGFGGF